MTRNELDTVMNAFSEKMGDSMGKVTQPLIERIAALENRLKELDTTPAPDTKVISLNTGAAGSGSYYEF
ncbi:MAG: hypothetical protein BWK73_32885 [Thiothrix lacustris]|uniref:Uncharacterized protein n=1 Tax=Thiothrix lacustris TaxID=525917 RepID=A0A1Y1QHC3_9GAMM|nr:MAG: hypothetical protein BWK73_32885 [Thiothrix lacustris]